MRIFMSAPLTQLVRGSESEANQFRAQWTSVMDALDAGGHEIFSAHQRESWGERIDPPAAALAADVGGLRWCELVIAYIGRPASPGVQLELGVALALSRRMLLFIHPGQDEPYLVRGIPEVADAELVEIADLSEVGDALRQRGLT